MSKNRNSRMQGNMNYNRPSGGYQKNLYKQQLKAQNIKQPKGIDEKTLRRAGIAIAACWLVLTVVLVIYLKWTGLLIGLVIGCIVTGGLWFFLQRKQKEMITYYKKIGMTEEMYLNELRKRNNNEKQIEQARKQWRKVKAESIFK